MTSASKSIRLLVAFTLTYLLIAAGFYLAQGNWEFIAYLGVTVLIGCLILGTLEKSRLDSFVLWLLSIWGLFHMLGGILPVGDGVLYGWRILPLVDRGGDFFILKMDQVIHFYGFGVSAMVMHQLMAARSQPWAHWGMLIFFSTMGALGLSAMNEIIEFLAYVNLEETGVGDIYNMGLDLIFNLAGALAGSFFQSWRSNLGTTNLDLERTKQTVSN